MKNFKTHKPKTGYLNPEETWKFINNEFDQYNLYVELLTHVHYKEPPGYSSKDIDLNRRSV